MSLNQTRRVRGFTLIETAISLAITGFALVSIMGMLPVGLTNFRLARQQTFYAEMIQTLQGQAEAASFAGLTPGSTFITLNFDGAGNPLSSATGAVYQASAKINANGTGNYNAGLNTNVQGSGATKTLLYATFSLTYVPTGKVLQQYPYFVGNNGS